MVNNYELLRGALNFTEPGYFYVLEVIKRRKDNPSLFKDALQLATYRIRSIEQLDQWFPTIVQMCDACNARAYIRLNRRNNERVAKAAMVRLATLINEGNYTGASRVFESVAGEQVNDDLKTWVVDLDHDLTMFEPGQEGIKEWHDSIKKFILQCTSEDLIESQRNMYLVPTPNGHHLITRPFDRKRFSIGEPSIDVHTNNPTILYAP